MVQAVALRDSGHPPKLLKVRRTKAVQSPEPALRVQALTLWGQLPKSWEADFSTQVEVPDPATRVVSFVRQETASSTLYFHDGNHDNLACSRV